MWRGDCSQVGMRLRTWPLMRPRLGDFASNRATGALLGTSLAQLARLVVIACLGVVLPMPGAIVVGGLLIDGQSWRPGMYMLDTVTGALTNMPFFYAGWSSATTGRQPGRVIKEELNLWEIDLLDDRNSRPLGTLSFSLISKPFFSVAYDTDNGVLYAAGRRLETDPSALWLADIGGPPHDIRPLQIGLFGADISIIEYAPGIGLLGMTETAIYNIDPNTGAATLRTMISWPGDSTGGLRVGDFAFDDRTGALITTLVPRSAYQPSRIYRIDPGTGLAGLLNDNAPPSLFGVARVDTPEPGTWIVGLALLAGIAVLRRKSPSPPDCRSGH